MELSGPSSEIPTVYQKILDLEILSRVHFQPKILCFRGYIVKQEMELLKQEMELSGPCREIATVQQIILGFGILSKGQFQPKILVIKVCTKMWHFCLIFWQLPDTNRDYLGYDTNFSNPLLYNPPSLRSGGLNQ